MINVSFGYLAGAHDGRGELDRFFDWVTNDPDRKTRIVLPAGNSQLSRCHATIDFAAGDDVEFDWIVQPEDRTQSVIEVWLPPAQIKSNRMRVTVTRPDGVVHSIDETLFAAESMFDGAQAIGLIELVERDLDGRRMFRIAIAPTARPQPHPGPLAPAGAWRLRFAPGKDAMDGEAHAWVQRDDSLYGYPQRGRQSYFDHEGYERFDDRGADRADDPAGAPSSPVTRVSLLNGIASGAEALTAGGYRRRDGGVADYSSGGPNTPLSSDPPPRRKPDALLPSDGSRVHWGVLAAGARSGARLALDGTSVASPQLARHVAELLAGGSDARRQGGGRPRQGLADPGPGGRAVRRAAGVRRGPAQRPRPAAAPRRAAARATDPRGLRAGNRGDAVYPSFGTILPSPKGAGLVSSARFPAGRNAAILRNGRLRNAKKPGVSGRSACPEPDTHGIDPHAPSEGRPTMENTMRDLLEAELENVYGAGGNGRRRRRAKRRNNDSNSNVRSNSKSNSANSKS